MENQISEKLQWFLGLNLVLAIWLGLLAEHWKGRGMVRWTAIGLVTSVAGPLLLLLVPSVKHGQQTALATETSLRRISCALTPEQLLKF